MFMASALIELREGLTMKRLRNILTILACYLRLDSLVIPLELHSCCAFGYR